MNELARLGSATVYEASGRHGLVDVELRQIVPGSRACGPARTVRCGQDDNLMVHAAMAGLQAGEVLVLTMPEPAPVALLGDLLATQAKVRGAAAVLVDAAVRDSEELAEMGLPVWARWVRSRGATKNIAGELDVPVRVGGQEIRPGDLVVLDADGATVVAAERSDEVLRLSLAREEKEAVKRAKLEAGALSYELDGLGRMSEIAHLGPVELLTPKGEESLRFFVDVMGMEIEHEDGASAYLRGWGDYQPWSLKLTESSTSGMGVLGLRAWSPEALERRVAAVEATGLGEGWVDGHAASASATPTVTASSSTTSASATTLLPTCAPRSRTTPAATPGAAARSSGSTTSTSWPPTSAPTATSASTRSATASTSASSSTTAPRPAPG